MSAKAEEDAEVLLEDVNECSMGNWQNNGSLFGVQSDASEPALGEVRSRDGWASVIPILFLGGDYKSIARTANGIIVGKASEERILPFVILRAWSCARSVTIAP